MECLLASMLMVTNKKKIFIPPYLVLCMDQDHSCIQECKVIVNVLPGIPVPHDEYQQEQGSTRTRHLRVTCTFEHNPELHIYIVSIS